MTKALAIPFDGSKPLKNNMWERYARLRAQALPRTVAYRKAGNTMTSDNGIGVNSHRLEKKPGIRARIEFLTRQAQDRIIEKRQRIEEHLWAVHEANLKDYFETYEATKTNKEGAIETDKTGRMSTVKRQRPRLLSELPDEAARLIDDVVLDRNGHYVPRLCSKAEASKALRAMHNIGRTEDRQESISLSDAELVQQLADQANQLGVKIDLAYSFEKPKPDDEPQDGAPVIDDKTGT